MSLNNESYGYLLSPHIQIMDHNGNPMTGAFLKVFEAGSSYTQVTTYSDWEGTAQHANKELDARGEVVIIASKSINYKVMLCDYTRGVDNPYWVLNNVSIESSSVLPGNVVVQVNGTTGEIDSTLTLDEEGNKVYTESLSSAFVTRVTNIESSLQTKESLQYTGFRINSGSGPFFVKIAEASFQSGYGSMDLTCGVGGSSTAYGEFSVKVIRAINGTSMYAQWNSLFNRASTFQLEEIRCFYVGPNDVQLWAKTASPFTQSSLSFEPLINVRYSSSGDAIGRAFSFQKVGTTGSYPSTYVNYCLAKSVDCLSASDQRRTKVTSSDASVEVTKTEVYDGKGYTNTFDLSVLSTSPALSFINIDSTNSPYLILESDNEIIVSTSIDDVIVTLPVTSLKRFYVKWLLGTHNLTVNVANSGMIDGVASFVFNDKFSVGTSVSFVCKESGDWIANGTITDGQVDTYKAMCSTGDIPGYLENKLVGSTWIDVTEIPLSADEKNIKFALKNPDFFVKGNTIYGGQVVGVIGDLDEQSHNGYYTCYHSTLHAPPAQPGNPSWFIHHMNSNTANYYAVQIAYAYTSTIICYERTKVAGVWQPWILRSNTGVGTGEVKVTSAGVAGYLANKLTVAPGSPLTATVSDDTLVLDFLENNVADPLIRTLDLLAENGTCELTGTCWSSEGSIEGGNWGGIEQNTTDSFYKIVPLSRGTVAKAAVYIAQVNGTDSYYGSGNYGAIRLGLFAADGTLKGQTAWTRGISAIGRLTLDLTAAQGQNLTIERNTQYWVGIIGRGLTLLSHNKSSSSTNLSSLRYSVQIRTSSSGASWGAFTTNGSGFVQKNIMIAQMSATEESA